MTNEFTFYCDESCHLEHDRQPTMVLGALILPHDKITEVNRRVKEIKEKHGLSRFLEMKWTKISPSQKDFFLDVIDLFFDDDDLKFRAVICDKQHLNHERFSQNHDDWYYKMYFILLRKLLSDENHYRIYLDIKDTCSTKKRELLHKVLCNDRYDFNKNMLKSIQHVRSHEVQGLQLADVLIGAVSYANRHLNTSTAKLEIIDRIRRRSHTSLLKTNYSNKFNLFQWSGQEP